MNLEKRLMTSKMNQFHPIVTVMLYCMILTISVFSNRPEIMIVSLAGALLYIGFLSGMKSVVSQLKLSMVVIFMTALINGLFTHNGATVLFYINTNRITTQAIFYGMMLGTLLSCVFAWSKAFSMLISSDKLIYIFSIFGAKVSLIVSMVFRSVPLLQNRYHLARLGQKSLNHNMRKIQHLKDVIAAVDVVIGWSLEAAIDSADSMVARGYGMKGRVTFHFFYWRTKDVIMLLIICVMLILVIHFYLRGEGTLNFYPEFIWKRPAPVLSGICVFAFFSPVIIDLIGGIRWNISKWKI